MYKSSAGTGVKKRKKKKSNGIIYVSLTIILLLIVLISVLLLLPSPSVSEGTAAEAKPSIQQIFHVEKIPNGVFISDLNVSGLSLQKAADKVSEYMNSNYPINDIILNYGETIFHLTKEDTGAYWDIQAAVKEAKKASDSRIDVPLVLDKGKIRAVLNDFFQPLGGIYTPSGFWLEGNAPDLNKNEEIEQFLVLNKGSTGLPIDTEEIIDQISDVYHGKLDEISIEAQKSVQSPKELQLENIQKQVTTAPINPTVDRSTLEIIPGRKGLAFVLSDAEKALKKAKASESIRIPMCYLEPSISEDEAMFQDILGYCITEHTDNENRNENLRLACSMLNDKVLQPGETLSYNLALGQRTTEAGYKPAPAYSGVELVNEIGGGICQVSSTLYLSSLFAELTIIERKNHGFPANYIPLGLDATVNWGTTDLKIRNDYPFPIKIVAEVTEEYVKIKIMGVEQRDYYVKMEYRVDDHPAYASAYRCHYDLETDEEISRELDHTSYYLEDVWCWPGYIQSATD